MLAELAAEGVEHGDGILVRQVPLMAVLGKEPCCRGTSLYGLIRAKFLEENVLVVCGPFVEFQR